MTLLLRVVISPKEARRILLTEVPASVDQLINVLKDKIQLEGDFSLQFEDPDFSNALCQLTQMSELPDGRAVLHIVCNTGASPLNLSDSHSIGSVSSLDTASLHSEDCNEAQRSPTRSFQGSLFESLPSPSSSSVQSNTDSPQTPLRRTTRWPNPFPIPKFAYDVELRLRKGNEVYERTQKRLILTGDMRSDIVNKLWQSIFDLRGAYPSKDELLSVASGLLVKYPCLKETDSVTGYDGWLKSLHYKMGNFRAKLRRAGCNEVMVNTKRRGEDGVAAPFILKRAKRGEVNHVPEYPDNHDGTTLEEERLALIEEMKKRKRNMGLIRQKMELTFSHRRREIVEVQPMVSEVQERWPALFSHEEISEEFYRITSRDLRATWNASLDKYVPRLIKLYRARKAAFGPDMEMLLNKLEETTDIVRHRRTAALKGLPIFVRDDASEFYLKCVNTDPEESVVEGVPVAILTVYVDDDAAAWETVTDIAIILEGAVILHNLPDLAAAYACLFGLLYAMDINYPEQMRYTFEAIQNIFFELGSRCSQRTRSLKEKLLL
ncbi:uncharacterized protein LOC118563005 [Fundulus heteroclitus]|uniref:uncharacterized protein LOC118563005 n=1 Tax=Fundulus heteroclitus TaxID=8078 RepID=UPI00165C322E|nr:uncharacterized protein LOC118563005 [Fundulus heteroclitus]XP_035992476.1 uncharacterized protein LOC118563005 [Fundulus heteroclitus]XP_035992477.1 uncharacterized protein LOC118563005 [Fundulus heteroclitus]XP_035992478.1 uncharacterized protein LOC118563005 [Fundulus heteroclitus]XP_035992479.1 uncharacterized protein LOC118563005 [Fundulus heteroclitus]XP_035992480.1 uncharacterized protein LOC118563005 [Fundulus heteroclitus]